MTLDVRRERPTSGRAEGSSVGLVQLRNPLEAVTSAAAAGRRASSGLPEAALFRAHGGDWPTFPCVCGAAFRADPADPAPGVSGHQLTARHRAWREREGI